jgi:hypothetical protein
MFENLLDAHRMAEKDYEKNIKVGNIKVDKNFYNSLIVKDSIYM